MTSTLMHIESPYTFFVSRLGLFVVSAEWTPFELLLSDRLYKIYAVHAVGAYVYWI